MIIGVPKEVKVHEYRIALTPSSVHELVHHGHEVVIEQHAGEGSGFSDQEYRDAGARLLDSAQDVFDTAALIIKVKEPQAPERAMLKPHHTLFTYLHLAPDIPQTQDLLKSGATCIAYETVTDREGRLPLLAPMSEVAGRMSIQAGARSLEKENGGRGVLLGGVPGVEPAHVVVLGGGVVGSNAIKMAVGLGARVTVLDKNIGTLRLLDNMYSNRITTVASTKHAIDHYLTQADLVIGAVLVPGAAAPKLLTRAHLKTMKEGAALVDVAIDQGGCFETSHPTTHADPTFVVDGVVHYCVANMPGAVARTSTQALNNATLPFILELANKGCVNALIENAHLRQGLNIYQSLLCCASVGEAQGIQSVTPEQALAIS
ncbi:MAG: alanine dehydrogenase [Oleiphilus sp.]|nr:MAG: alanine dehydrogenase [Oleiphilus sp.]